MLIGISGKMGSGKDTVGKILQMLNQGIDSGKQILDYIDGVNIEGFDYEIKKFANKPKDIACLLIGCTREQLEDREFKEKELGEEWKKYFVTKRGFMTKIYINESEIKKYAESTDELGKNYLVQSEILTPRKLLQLLGTEAGRNIIHPNIWVNALFADYKVEGKINVAKSIKDIEEVDIDLTNKKHRMLIQGEEIHKNTSLIPNWIITDVRFPNEVQAIKDRGGIVIRVNRDIEYPVSTNEHPSETALDDCNNFDYIIDNNGSIEELMEKIKQLKL